MASAAWCHPPQRTPRRRALTVGLDFLTSPAVNAKPHNERTDDMFTLAELRLLIEALDTLDAEYGRADAVALAERLRAERDRLSAEHDD
jgi:hypothetical protein